MNTYLQEVFSQTADDGYFDFARCMRDDGTIYASPTDTCRKGKKIDDDEVPAKKTSDKKMQLTAKIKAMSAADLQKVADDPRLSDRQKRKLQRLLRAKKAETPTTATAQNENPKKEPAKKAQPDSNQAKDAKVKPPVTKTGEMEIISKQPSKTSDEKIKETFNRALTRYRELDKQEKALRAEGARYDDPRIEALSSKKAAAEQALRVTREAYHAIDRDEFLKAAGQEIKASKEMRVAIKAVSDARANPLGDPKILENAYDAQRAVGAKVSEASQLKTAAYFGEPKTTTNKPDNGGQVNSAIPSSLPKGGADKALKDYLDGSQIVMQQTPANLSKIVESGEALNMFQVGKSGIGGKGESYRNSRIETELRTLGVARDANPDQRPLYAALDNPDRTRSLSGSGTMPQYGGVSIALKPEVKDRSTFTLGDSLDDAKPRGMQASPVRDPAQPETSFQSPGSRGEYSMNVKGNGSNSNDFQVSEKATPKMKYTPPYTEVQIFGGLKTSDIQEVRVYEGHKVSPKVVKALQEQGVRVVRLPPQLNNIRFSSSDDEFGDITAINPKSL
jgi:hypothetical protein